MTARAGSGAVDWPDATSSLVEREWVRLASVVDDDTCARLEAAAPAPWEALPEFEGIVSGQGWPYENSECPIHEVESPRVGDRMTMTLRHNTGGPGADYFIEATD